MVSRMSNKGHIVEFLDNNWQWIIQIIVIPILTVFGTYFISIKRDQIQANNDYDREKFRYLIAETDSLINLLKMGYLWEYGSFSVDDRRLIESFITRLKSHEFYFTNKKFIRRLATFADSLSAILICLEEDYMSDWQNGVIQEIFPLPTQYQLKVEFDDVEMSEQMRVVRKRAISLYYSMLEYGINIGFTKID